VNFIQYTVTVDFSPRTQRLDHINQQI